MGLLATKDQVAKLIAVFHQGTKLTYQKGEYVVRPGETPSAVYYIEQGLVKAFNISKYGEENLLIIRQDREIFPLIWAITGQEREIVYQTLGPTTVWRIGRKQYLEYLQSNPDVLPPLLDMAIEMYRRHSERILNLEYRTVRERLVSFLLTMSTRFGKQTKEGLVIDVPLRQQDIASSINSSRETTSRELSYLERKGLIKLVPPKIILKDIEKLQAHL